MKVALIGSNGTLATAFGKYCNEQEHYLSVFGRSKPKYYHCDSFYELDLMSDSLEKKELYDADVLIYASGAGVQSYKHDSDEIIYHLNVEVPITLHSLFCKNTIGGG